VAGFGIGSAELCDCGARHVWTGFYWYGINVLTFGFEKTWQFESNYPLFKGDHVPRSGSLGITARRILTLRLEVIPNLTGNMLNKDSQIRLVYNLQLVVGLGTLTVRKQCVTYIVTKGSDTIEAAGITSHILFNGNTGVQT
jgi:hypothetical protein